MSIDILILVSAWIITVILLVLFIPKDKIREALVNFLFVQVITWLTGLLVVELRLVEYPMRTFSYANRTSFDFEYFIYPSISAVFNLHYPKGKSRTRIFLYYFYYCSGMTVIEAFLETYTDIIKYIHWNWSITWISFFITFLISRKFYVWFYNKKSDKTALP